MATEAEPGVSTSLATDPDIHHENKRPRTEIGSDADETPVASIHELPGVTMPPAPQANGGNGSILNGLKRSREAFEDEIVNGSAKETLQVLTPRLPTPDLTAPDHELRYFDDKNHPDFEWVRLPKKRDYDLFQALRIPSWDRNHAQVPVTATRYSDGKEVTMWAKMDTGSSANTINRSTLKHLLGDSMAAALTLLDVPEDFKGFGDGEISCTHSVTLDISAGRHHRKFAGVFFYVIPDDEPTADTDGRPNVLLGLDTLKEHHMLMIDLEFLHDRDHDLEVIAEKTDDERPGQGGIFYGLASPHLTCANGGSRPAPRPWGPRR